MCGILGWISPVNLGSRERGTFERVLDGMKRRGPDDRGVVMMGKPDGNWRCKHARSGDAVVEDCRGFLGHRRLSIVDLSEAGHQPMASRDGRIWITYNGEVFNYIELRSELTRLGWQFTTNSDTEVILAAYEAWGTDCFAHFNGMWAIAVVDLEADRLVLSRDHFGIKPLYYRRASNGTWFGSTCSAVLAISGCERRAAANVVREFVLFAEHPRPGFTFYEGIEEVPAAHFVAMSLGDPQRARETTRWWRVGTRDGARDVEYEEFRQLFSDAVRIRLRSDVTVGSCLSGGLDSSSIVVAATRALGKERPFRTISSDYVADGFSERRFAEEVVRVCGTDAVWTTPGENALLWTDIQEVVQAQEKPFPSLAVYSQYCVMRAARDAGVTVLLDGQGGDETLLGYDASIAAYVLHELKRGAVIRGAALARQLSKKNDSFRGLGIVRWVARAGGRAAVDVRKRATIGGFLTPECLAVADTERSGGVLAGQFSEHRLQLLERSPLPALLHHEDRNSMTFSVETRLPFLDYRLAALAFETKPAVLMAEGWSKRWLRRYLNESGCVTAAWRLEKKGFATPTKRLMEVIRPQLQECLKDSLKSERLLRPELLRALAKAHAFADWHWRLLSVELWMKQLAVE